MATFEVKAYTIRIEPHPNADAIELAVIGGYRSIVQKGTYKDGDLVVYIPEAAVLPEKILKRLNFWDAEHSIGKLNGPKGNRVKAIRLRGVMSQGIIFPLEYNTDIHDMVTHTISNEWILALGECGSGIIVKEGDEVGKSMGITKYEPPIPVHMAGEVFNAFGMTVKYDVENYKKWPDILVEGEEVVMTEKLHGTWCCMGYHPDSDVPIVTSKGLSDKGVAFKFNDANKGNLYLNALRATNDEDGDDVVTRFRKYRDDLVPFYILGEIYGVGIQDLKYGGNPPAFRVFDIYIGQPSEGRYVGYAEMVTVCAVLNLPTVPLLYRGPFSAEKMLELTSGKETVSGTEACIREGLVTKPVVERRDDLIGRVMLKNVSDAYLGRRNATEYN